MKFYYIGSFLLAGAMLCSCSEKSNEAENEESTDVSFEEVMGVVGSVTNAAGQIHDAVQSDDELSYEDITGVVGSASDVIDKVNNAVDKEDVSVEDVMGAIGSITNAASKINDAVNQLSED